MTDSEFFTEYLRREKAASKTMRGQDVNAILSALCKEHGMAYEEGRRIILDRTSTGGG